MTVIKIVIISSVIDDHCHPHRYFGDIIVFSTSAHQQVFKVCDIP